MAQSTITTLDEFENHMHAVFEAIKPEFVNRTAILIVHRPDGRICVCRNAPVEPVKGMLEFCANELKDKF